MDPVLSQLLEITKLAGTRILEHYHQDPGTVIKDDASPLTLADLASHRVICDELARLFPDTPICSEEGSENGDPKANGCYWLVDPLDGTKEFIKKTGSFTVNIALIEYGRPTYGVIHVPVSGVTYLGGVGLGAFRMEADAAPVPIQVSQVSNPPRFVASRDHAGPEVQKLVKSFPGAECLSIGSSLKFCLVAEGAADAYLRDVPTMEWDTAAAHAILHAAGGELLTWPDLEPLAYGKPDWKNGSLLTVGTRDFAKRLLRKTS